MHDYKSLRATVMIWLTHTHAERDTQTAFDRGHTAIGVARILSGVHFFLKEVDDLF